MVEAHRLVLVWTQDFPVFTIFLLIVSLSIALSTTSILLFHLIIFILFSIICTFSLQVLKLECCTIQLFFQVYKIKFGFSIAN